jgi:hypothetical protein
MALEEIDRGRVVPVDNDPNDSCGRWYSIVPRER